MDEESLSILSLQLLPHLIISRFNIVVTFIVQKDCVADLHVILTLEEPHRLLAVFFCIWCVSPSLLEYLAELFDLVV